MLAAPQASRTPACSASQTRASPRRVMLLPALVAVPRTVIVSDNAAGLRPAAVNAEKDRHAVVLTQWSVVGGQ